MTCTAAIYVFTWIINYNYYERQYNTYTSQWDEKLGG